MARKRIPWAIDEPCVSYFAQEHAAPVLNGAGIRNWEYSAAAVAVVLVGEELISEASCLPVLILTQHVGAQISGTSIVNEIDVPFVLYRLPKEFVNVVHGVGV
jgi:hypothetical protein